MNQQTPIELDYHALITPKGMIALVVRSPRLIASASTYVLGSPWNKLLGEGWTSQPCDVNLRLVSDAPQVTAS